MSHGTTHEHDVIIIGGGGAGLRASIAIAQENPSLRAFGRLRVEGVPDA